MCQQISRSVFEKKTEDIYGNKLWFATITHGQSEATKEFVLTKEVFNLKRWLFLMTLFSCIAFYCEFYTADASLLGIFLGFLCLVLLLKLHLKVKQESLLVIASLGLQLTTTFVTGRKASQFILREDIYDVVINEGIFMFGKIYLPFTYDIASNMNMTVSELIKQRYCSQGPNRVLFYLAVLLKDMKDPLKFNGIIPLFRYTLPRIDALQYIYEGVQTTFHLSTKHHEE